MSASGVSHMHTLPAFTAGDWSRIFSDDLKDKAHLSTQLGGDLAEYLSWAENEAGKAQRTLDTYERDLARLAKMFPRLGRHEFTKAENRACITSFPPKSRRRVWSALRDFWGWQYDEERIDANPMRGIRCPKPQPAKVVRVFTDGERGKLIAAAGDESLMPVVDEARQLFLHETGARKGEARQFRMGDAHLGGGRPFVILYGKGSKERRVPIRGELVRALEAIQMFDVPRLGRPLNEPDDHLFFPARVMGAHGSRPRQVSHVDPKKPMGESSFHGWWVKCVERAGVGYRKPHTTRHTYATDLLDATGDLVSVKDALGHASTRTTEVYLHNAQARLERAIDALNASRQIEIKD